MGKGVGAFSKIKKGGRRSNKKNDDPQQRVRERAAALLSELRSEGKRSSFSDQRFSIKKSKNYSVVKDELVKKFRQSRLEKKRRFLLNDSAQNPLSSEFTLTHRGQPLQSNGTVLNDSVEEDLYLGDSDSSNGEGSELQQALAEAHFGGTKSRQEIYSEIIRKSKKAKIEKAKEKESQELQLEKFDSEFKDIRSDLAFRPEKWSREGLSETNQEESKIDSYDMLAKELKFQERTRPTDRLRTPKEIAEARAARLEKQEKMRQKIMEQERVSSDEEEDEASTRHSDSESSTEEADDSPSSSESESDLSEELRVVITDEETDLQVNTNNNDNMPTQESIHFEEQKNFGDWTVNENDEDLPFKVILPSSIEDIYNLCSGREPAACWKLLHRARAAADVNLSPGNAQRLKDFLKNLILYALRIIKEDFEKYMNNIGTLSVSFAKLSPLHDHIVELGSQFPSELDDLLMRELITACTSSGNTASSSALQSSLETNSHFQRYLEGLPSFSHSSSRTLSLITVILRFFNIFTLLPLTSLLFGLLEEMASSLYHQETLLKPFYPFTQKSSSSLPLSLKSSLGQSLIVLSLLVSLSMKVRKYSALVIPLSMAILSHCAKTQTPIRSSILKLCINAVQMTVTLATTTSKLRSPDTVILFHVLPTLYALEKREGRPIEPPLKTLIEQMELIVSQPMPPLCRTPNVPQSIRMFTPNYVDPTQRSGARHLRLRGATEEHVERVKLRRDVAKERRAAARQLKQDAALLMGVQAKEKLARNSSRQQERRRVIKLMDQEQQTIHQLRTSGADLKRK